MCFVYYIIRNITLYATENESKVFKIKIGNLNKFNF